MDSQKDYPKLFSFEFFPPKTLEGVEKLRHTQRQLAQLHPAFFSVTFGAGGSTRDRTLETVLDILKHGDQAAPHISCVGTNKSTIKEILNQYIANGIRHVVALRGDLPSGTYGGGEFRYASELVDFIRREVSTDLIIEVAAYPETHPQARSAQDDMIHFKRKVEAGANAAITQYFYNADAYFDFIDRCEQNQIDIPIVPGIMPIANFFQLSRFSEACGAEIPRWIKQKMAGYGDDSASIRAFGLDVVTSLCDTLLSHGAPGLHFYTMNSAGLTSVIWDRLHLSSYR